MEVDNSFERLESFVDYAHYVLRGLQIGRRESAQAVGCKFQRLGKIAAGDFDACGRE